MVFVCFILFILFYVYACFDFIYICAPMCVWCTKRSEEKVFSLGTGGTDDCELSLNMGAGFKLRFSAKAVSTLNC